MAEVVIKHGIKTEGITFNTFLNVDLTVLKKKTPYPFSVLISQHQVEVLLRQKLAELNVPLFSNKVMTAYSYDDKDGLLVAFEDGSKVRTRYLVGADGARSTVSLFCSGLFYRLMTPG